MQILGKRSKVLLTALCAIILISIGISFAAWDSMAVKADGGNMSDYANAKVGDIVTFGRYYDYEKDANGNYVEGSTVIDKYPMTWIVVDKNERTGQLTLMSQYIIACGSYFGNYYMNAEGNWDWHYGKNKELNGNPYNQAYCDSTARAYLNNLERLDLGGDEFIAPDTENGIAGGYSPSNKASSTSAGLLSSVGFSNQRYWTGLTTATYSEYASMPGFVKRLDNEELYYQRPLTDIAYENRPAAKGFYDEAFTDDEKANIVPQIIAGYIGHRWPDNKTDVSTKSYVEGTFDKVWMPSATELNVMNGKDWNGQGNDAWMNPSDEASSTVFEYFRNYAEYKNPYLDKYNSSLEDALTARRTELAKDGVKGNYSIPIYDKGTTNRKTDISNANTSEHYWTRSPMSGNYANVRVVSAGSGRFGNGSCDWSARGIRPCVTIKY